MHRTASLAALLLFVLLVVVLGVAPHGAAAQTYSTINVYYNVQNNVGFTAVRVQRYVNGTLDATVFSLTKCTHPDWWFVRVPYLTGTNPRLSFTVLFYPQNYYDSGYGTATGSGCGTCQTVRPTNYYPIDWNSYNVYVDHQNIGTPQYFCCGGRLSTSLAVNSPGYGQSSPQCNAPALPKPTLTPTRTSAASATASFTASATASYTQTATASFTQTATASFTQTATPSFTQSATASFTQTATASWTHSATASLTQSATASFSQSRTATSTASATPTPLPATVLYYRNNGWYYNSSIASVKLVVLSSALVQLGVVPLSKCSASIIDDFWITTVSALGATPANNEYLVKAYDAGDNEIAVDSTICSASNRWTGINFANAATLRDANPGGCAGTVTSPFDGHYTSGPSACVAPTPSVTIASTKFIYQNVNWYNNFSGVNSIASVSLRTTSGVTTVQTQLYKCGTSGYYFGVINYMQPSSAALTFMPTGWSGSGLTGNQDGYDHYPCGSGNLYPGSKLNWAASYNLLQGSTVEGNNFCGGTVSVISVSTAASYCSFLPLPTVTVNYRNPLWGSLPNVAAVGLWTLSNDLQRAYITTMSRTGPSCWSATVAATSNTPASQQFLPVAYNSSALVLYYDNNNCQGLSNYQADFVANKRVNLDTNSAQGCGGVVSYGVLSFDCSPLIATPTPTASATESSTASTTASFTQSATTSATASYTRTATASATQSASASFTQSATASFTESATASAIASATASGTTSGTASWTETDTVSSTESATATTTPAPPATATPSATATTPLVQPFSAAYIYYSNPSITDITSLKLILVLGDSLDRRRAQISTAEFTFHNCSNGDYGAVVPYNATTEQRAVGFWVQVTSEALGVIPDYLACLVNSYYSFSFYVLAMRVASSCGSGAGGTSSIAPVEGPSPTCPPLPRPPYIPPQPTATSTSMPTAPSGDTSSNLPTILGAIIGGLIGLVLLLIIVIYFVSLRRNQWQLKRTSELHLLETRGIALAAGTASSTEVTRQHYPPVQASGAVDATKDSRASNDHLFLDDSLRHTISQNMTLLNTLDVAALPGFLQMTMEQLQLQSSIVGAGGNGQIHRAVVVDPDWKRQNPSLDEVAVKLVPGNPAYDEEANKMHFGQEVAAMNALRFHPNIIRLLGYIESPRAIVTPLYRGDLYGFLHRTDAFRNRQAPWTMANCLDVAHQIALALYTMHGMNIIHRDMKTKNVLLEDIDPARSLSGFPYRARVCDFGISRIVQRELTNELKGVGYLNVFGLSARYAAPEVFAHMNIASMTVAFESQVEMKSDVYAFAICLWEMVEQQQPWLDQGKDDIDRRVSSGQRPEFSQPAPGTLSAAEMALRTALVSLTQRCWEQLASFRPSIEAVIAELESLLEPLRRDSARHFV